MTAGNPPFLHTQTGKELHTVNVLSPPPPSPRARVHTVCDGQRVPPPEIDRFVYHCRWIPLWLPARMWRETGWGGQVQEAEGQLWVEASIRITHERRGWKSSTESDNANETSAPVQRAEMLLVDGSFLDASV